MIFVPVVSLSWTYIESLVPDIVPELVIVAPLPAVPDPDCDNSIALPLLRVVEELIVPEFIIVGL